QGFADAASFARPLGEAVHPGVESLCGRLGFQEGSRVIAQWADLVAVDLFDQVLPGGEVPVEGAASHARALGDRVERDRLSGGECLGGRGEQVLSVALGIGAQGASSRCHGLRVRECRGANRGRLRLVYSGRKRGPLRLSVASAPARSTKGSSCLQRSSPAARPESAERQPNSCTPAATRSPSPDRTPIPSPEQRASFPTTYSSSDPTHASWPTPTLSWRRSPNVSALSTCCSSAPGSSAPNRSPA